MRALANACDKYMLQLPVLMCLRMNIANAPDTENQCNPPYIEVESGFTCDASHIHTDVYTHTHVVY